MGRCSHQQFFSPISTSIVLPWILQMILLAFWWNTSACMPARQRTVLKCFTEIHQGRVTSGSTKTDRENRRRSTVCNYSKEPLFKATSSILPWNNRFKIWKHRYCSLSLVLQMPFLSCWNSVAASGLRYQQNVVHQRLVITTPGSRGRCCQYSTKVT